MAGIFMTKYDTLEETNTEIWHLLRHLSLFHPTVEKYEELQGLIDDLHILHTARVNKIFERVRLLKVELAHQQRKNVDMLDVLFEK